MKNNEKVVITGCSSISALGYKKSDIINNLKHSKIGFREDHFYKIEKNIKNKISEKYKTNEITSNLALFVFEKALKDAKLTEYDITNNDFISFSSSKGGVETLFNICFDEKNYSKYFFNYFPSSSLSYISSFLKKNTPGFNIVSACSSGLYSIISAYYSIMESNSNIAISGSSESSFIPVIINAFHNMNALTFDECKPFDINRNGFVMGEGSGCIILESEKSAKKRNANILGIISGFSRLTDTSHITGLDTSGETISRAIEIALNGDKNIDWINVHGTGTKQNDEAEYNALKKVFKKELDYIPVSSFKPYIGHLLGASASVEIIFSLYAMNNNFVPANPNTKHPEYPLYMPEKTIYKNIKRILKLSYGFGGHIGALVLEKN